MNKLIAVLLGLFGLGGSGAGTLFLIAGLAIVSGAFTFFIVKRACVKKINENLVKDFSIPTDIHVHKGMELIKNAPLIASITVILAFLVIGFIK